MYLLVCAFDAFVYLLVGDVRCEQLQSNICVYVIHIYLNNEAYFPALYFCLCLSHPFFGIMDAAALMKTFRQASLVVHPDKACVHHLLYLNQTINNIL